MLLDRDGDDEAVAFVPCSALPHGRDVMLSRHTYEMCIPWGFELDPTTLELSGCAKGSVAAASELLRGCVGLFLTAVNNMQVANMHDVATTVNESKRIYMHFERTPQGLSFDGKSPAQQQHTAVQVAAVEALGQGCEISSIAISR